MKRVLTQIEKLLAVAGVELSNLLPLDYALAVLRHQDSTPELRAAHRVRFIGHIMVDASERPDNLPCAKELFC
jgi:hypothetical protein